MVDLLRRQCHEERFVLCQLTGIDEQAVTADSDVGTGKGARHHFCMSARNEQ